MATSSAIAVVTGAGSGIGKASAVALSKSGFSLALLGRRIEALQTVESEITGSGGTALAIPTDVTDEKAVSAAFAKVHERFGRIDLLFNNAGMALPALTIDELTVEQWKNVVDLNLTGAFLCARQAFRIMRAQSPRGGRIINNGSISAHVPRLHAVPYTTTKHGITGLTKSLSLDGRKFDIACGQIDIGNTESSMTARVKTGALQAGGEITAEPTFDVAHVANAIVYMASLPLNANVQFMTVMATKMPYIGRG